MTAKQAAMNISAGKPGWKEAAEKMMGCKLEEMTPEQRVLAAEILAAFDGVWQETP